jgi:hypothetical protein
MTKSTKLSVTQKVINFFTGNKAKKRIEESNALLKEISTWLVKDFVRALEAIDTPFELDDTDWSTDKKLENCTMVHVRTDHVQGATSAYYKISAFDTSLMMRITLNTYRFVVLLYVEEMENKNCEDLKSCLEIVTSGAKHVGFDVTFDKNTQSWSSGANLCEIYFRITVPKDFLYNGTERLYWAQDIATMVRSSIITLERNGWLKTERPSPTMGGKADSHG